MLPAERERVAPPSRAALAALGLTTLAALAATGCLTPWGARPRPHCPIELVPSDALSEGAAWRARIELSSGADEPRAIRGEVAARVEGGVLRLAALTPFGTRAFTIVQRGTQPTVDDLLGRRLGLEPLWILDAFHRLHALEALDARPAPPVGGPVVWSHGGERIEESAVATGPRRCVVRAGARSATTGAATASPGSASHRPVPRPRTPPPSASSRAACNWVTRILVGEGRYSILPGPPAGGPRGRPARAARLCSAARSACASTASLVRTATTRS